LSISGETRRTRPITAPTPATSRRAGCTADSRVSGISASSSTSPFGDDAKHGLGAPRREAADAGHAAANDAVGRRDHLGAAAPPKQLAPLRLDLALFGFGHLEPIARGQELRHGCARGLLAPVVGAFGQVSGGAQGFGAFEGRVGLKQPGLCLDDTAPGLGARCLGARERDVVLRELGFERVGDKAGEPVALFHAHALVGQHLGDA